MCTPKAITQKLTETKFPRNHKVKRLDFQFVVELSKKTTKKKKKKKKKSKRMKNWRKRTKTNRKKKKKKNESQTIPPIHQINPPI